MKTIFLAVALCLSTFTAGVVMAAEQPAQTTKATSQATDPVCGMTVDTKGAKNVFEYKGKKYYFCSKEDMEKFKASPKKYIKK